MRAGGQTGSGIAPQYVFSQNPLEVLMPEPLLDFGGDQDTRLTVVFRADAPGIGEAGADQALTREFLQALCDHPEPPRAILFYQTGVRLVVDGSPFLDLLRQLADRGSELLACQTSLRMLCPGRQTLAGRAAALAELVDRLRQAARVILWP